MHLKRFVVQLSWFAIFFAFNLLIAHPVEFESSNLPIIVINTHGQTIPDEYRIVADMGIIFNGPGQRNYVNQPFNHFQGKIAIELRGSSSQMFPKKQYAFETQTENGDNLNVSLLGLPRENDWILYGPYSDKSLMRNVLIYQLSREMGQYASRTRFCELILNDDYRGLYILMEKIKRDKHRVHISKLKAEETTGDELTGGYIIKIDKLAGEEIDGWYSIFPPYPESNYRIYYQYHYPKPDRIVKEQKTYIQNWIFRFEKTFYANTFMEVDSGYYRFVNLNSFIDFFILNEISRNVDGYRLSTFMYKDRDSKDPYLHMGPIWDFNLGFGNADYYHAYQTDGWQVHFNRDPETQYDPFKIPFWWERLVIDSVFMKQMIQRYQQLRSSILATDHIVDLIHSYVDTLSEAQVRNFERWPILGTYVWPNYYVGQNYEDEIQYLINWIKNRLNWMDSQLFDTEPPTAPSQLSLLAINHSSVSISWKTAEDNVGIAGYDIYLDGEYCKSTRISYVQISDLLDDHSYTISVRSRDFAANRSLDQAILTVKTPPFTAADGIIALKTNHFFNIDGEMEHEWSAFPWHDIKNTIAGNIANESDLSAKFKMAWNDTYIYLFVKINDEQKVRDSGGNFWADDLLEVYFDMDNGKSNNFTNNDFQFQLTLVDSNLRELQHQAISGVLQKVTFLNDGYQIEMAFPWTTLLSGAKNGKLIGFDLQIDDDDNGGDRDAKIGWWSERDRAVPADFGQVKFKTTLTALEQKSFVPRQFVLLKNFPNPFNNQTTIEFSVQIRSTVKLILFDVKGRKLKTVFNGPLDKGEYRFTLNMHSYASGLYFIRLTGKSKTGFLKQEVKIVHLK